MISIIVPVLNEESTIEATISQLMQLEGEKEIIVVDGGSRDQTVQLIEKYPCIILQSPKGRAKQMNIGATRAQGEILWFVHSDSKLQKGSLTEIKRAIDKGYDGGSFLLHFNDTTTKFMKFVQVTSNWRARFLKLIFGDQGLFIKRMKFEQLGGYNEIEIMEDWDFSIRIHKIAKMKQLKIMIGTSARRFNEGGQLKTLILMHTIKLLYLLGVHPEKLAKLYRQVR